MKHLTEFTTSTSESKKDKEVAEDLYERLTSYNAFLFIYLYRDLAGIMATTTRLLQRQDLRIRDIGRLILNLCESLQVNYLKLSDVPTELLGDGAADNIMEELFSGKCTNPTVFNLIFSYLGTRSRTLPVTNCIGTGTTFFGSTTSTYSDDPRSEHKF